MTERTGGYPLMNLAQDRGIAYADVLLWADYIRHARVTREPYPQGRFENMAEAVERIGAHLSSDGHRTMCQEMVAHGDERWGPAHPIHIPTFYRA